LAALHVSFVVRCSADAWPQEHHRVAGLCPRVVPPWLWQVRVHQGVHDEGRLDGVHHLPGSRVVLGISALELRLPPGLALVDHSVVGEGPLLGGQHVLGDVCCSALYLVQRAAAKQRAHSVAGRRPLLGLVGLPLLPASASALHHPMASIALQRLLILGPFPSAMAPRAGGRIGLPTGPALVLSWPLSLYWRMASSLLPAAASGGPPPWPLVLGSPLSWQTFWSG
jgi:hypothetical protein